MRTLQHYKKYLMTCTFGNLYGDVKSICDFVNLQTRPDFVLVESPPCFDVNKQLQKIEKEVDRVGIVWLLFSDLNGTGGSFSLRTVRVHLT